MCVNLEDQCSLPTGPKVLRTDKKHTKIEVKYY